MFELRGVVGIPTSDPRPEDRGGGDTLEDAYDLRNVATHEAGHSLVLLDLTEDVYSEMTMYGDTAKGETKKRSLEWGDLEGLHYLYG